MFFEAGQKIVCVGGKGTPRGANWWKEWASEWGITLPKRGTLYTVRETRIAADGTQRIRLCEIRNPLIEFTDAPDQECWFWSVNFRPIIKRETDISVFKRMLVPGGRELETL